MKKFFLAVLAAGILGAGCFTVGRDFPTQEINGIRNGVTNKVDLVRIFGEPYQRGLEDGRETWTYVWVRYGSNSGSKELHVKFAPDGVVSSYSYSSSFPEGGR